MDPQLSSANEISFCDNLCGPSIESIKSSTIRGDTQAWILRLINLSGELNKVDKLGLNNFPGTRPAKALKRRFLSPSSLRWERQKAVKNCNYNFPSRIGSALRRNLILTRPTNRKILSSYFISSDRRKKKLKKRRKEKPFPVSFIQEPFPEEIQSFPSSLWRKVRRRGEGESWHLSSLKRSIHLDKSWRLLTAKLRKLFSSPRRRHLHENSIHVRSSLCRCQNLSKNTWKCH